MEKEITKSYFFNGLLARMARVVVASVVVDRCIAMALSYITMDSKSIEESHVAHSLEEGHAHATINWVLGTLWFILSKHRFSKTMFYHYQ